MLYLLKKAIDQQMKKDEFIRNNRGFHYEYFLRDLLDEKIAVGKPLFARMNYVHTEFNGTLYCMIIEAARSSHTLNTMHIRSVFETDFSNTLTLMYNGSILVLFRLLDFDEANRTHLAEILYVYLICERNIATASEHMQMHRNTLVYRLKKINSLVTINYESYEERQHIILSYELYRKKQRPTFALESLENYHDS